ncbi:MAG: DMT family transporter [Flavobacteriales bacterium]|nr:DMT family transporter [Flavobacteriales bacterium]MCX7650988.1 DMT family transporter [Flavobacteriales bacterium]MDW8432430.1 DMT family transporter [Flavobacteriales bacterium]
MEKPAVQVGVLVLLGALWGSSFLLIKKALLYFLPWEAALIRIVISACVLVPLVTRHLRNFSMRDLSWLVITGLFGNGIPAFLWALAQQGLDSSFGGLINATTPLFTLGVSAVFFKKIPRRFAWMGLGLGTCGAVLFFVLARRWAGPGQFSAFHAALGLAGAACYGVSLNLIRHRLQHVHPLSITGVPFVFMGAVSFMTLMAFSQPWQWPQKPGVHHGLLYLTLLGVFATGFGVWLFNRLLKHTSALFASSVTYLIPVFAMFFSFLAGEPFHVFLIPVLVLILSGIFLIQKSG